MLCHQNGHQFVFLRSSIILMLQMEDLTSIPYNPSIDLSIANQYAEGVDECFLSKNNDDISNANEHDIFKDCSPPAPTQDLSNGSPISKKRKRVSDPATTDSATKPLKRGDRKRVPKDRSDPPTTPDVSKSYGVANKERKRQKKKKEKKAEDSAAAAKTKNAASLSSAYSSANPRKKQKLNPEYSIKTMTWKNRRETKTKVSLEDFLKHISGVTAAGEANAGKFANSAIHYLISTGLSLRGLFSHAQHVQSGARYYLGPDEELADDTCLKYSNISMGTDADFQTLILDGIVEKTKLKETDFLSIDKIRKAFFLVKLMIKEKNQKHQQIYLRLLPIFILPELKKLVDSQRHLSPLDIEDSVSIIALIRKTGYAHLKLIQTPRS